MSCSFLAETSSVGQNKRCVIGIQGAIFGNIIDRQYFLEFLYWSGCTILPIGGIICLNVIEICGEAFYETVFLSIVGSKSVPAYRLFWK